MSLGDTGLPVVVKAKTDAEYTDGGTYVMLWNDAAKAYFDQDKNGRQGWVDRSEAEAMGSELAIWKLQINEDGTFQFGVPNESKACESPEFDEENSSYNAKLWAGWNGYETNTEVILCLDTEIYESGYKWVAVSEEEYNAFVPTYALRKNLYVMMLKAEEDGVNIPSSVANAFNDNDATVADLQAAIDLMGNLILKHDIETKGEADVTSRYIVNPNFDSQNAGWSNSTGESWWNTDDWHYRPESIENADASSSMNGYICRYVWSGGWIGNLPNTETSQTIALPAGSYRLEADCVGFQEGMGEDQYGSPQDWCGKVKGFYLFAKSELGEERVTVNTNSADPTDKSKVPQHFKLEFMSTGGEVTIGLKIDDAFGSFFGGDNFRLYCTKLIASPDIVELTTLSDELKAFIENSDTAPFSIETITQAENLVEQSEDVIAKEDVDACQPLIAAARELIEKINMEIAAYAKLRDAYEVALAAIEAGDYDILLAADEVVPALRSYVDAMLEHISKGDLTAEQCYEQIGSYTSKLAHYFADDVNAIDEGIDVTCLLANGTLTRGTEWYNGTGSQECPGWNGERPWGYSPGNDAAKGQIEYLGQDFDFYQVLPNMPAGVYTFEFRGFYRWGAKEAVVEAIGTADEEGKNTSRFYMNNFEAPIKSITADAFPLTDADDEAGSGNYATGTSDAEGNALYMPDASWYFMWRHRNCYMNAGAVAIEEGSALRIGFRAAGDDKERWAMISAPTLRYEGTSERALALLDATAISTPAVGSQQAIYTINGLRASALQRGINIVVTKNADGTTSAKKVFVK